MFLVAIVAYIVCAPFSLFLLDCAGLDHLDSYCLPTSPECQFLEGKSPHIFAHCFVQGCISGFQSLALVFLL